MIDGEKHHICMAILWTNVLPVTLTEIFLALPSFAQCLHLSA